jgi:hypothetical protein
VRLEIENDFCQAKKTLHSPASLRHAAVSMSNKLHRFARVWLPLLDEGIPEWKGTQ